MAMNASAVELAKLLLPAIASAISTYGAIRSELATVQAEVRSVKETIVQLRTDYGYAQKRIDDILNRSFK